MSDFSLSQWNTKNFKFQLNSWKFNFLSSHAMYLKLNKNSPLLSCKICICSHLRLNSITLIFSTSTRFGIFHPARLIMQMCRIASKTLTWNKLFKRQKKKDDETNLNKEGVFQRWNGFCSLRLTIKCNGVVLVWFLQKIRGRDGRLPKRLNTSLHVV